ncbi:aminodeoxychorismate synthase component I [Aestuariivirga sp.]|uniref:aminodeoxychorismate synthase component I n=1 Tax=Aestuariivirga sp. TaxID=2650926 RepID=UPI0025B8C9CD|nr:aminodeoxychorismate synthase component I [Aestuariivirga sp.]MCA3556203.1 aminodeoxychorismate synthase component I [Aestuariivirga sp.]
MREPHAREIVCLEPSALALRLKGERHLTLLESVMRSEHLGRYSFLACNPAATIEVNARGAFFNGVPLAGSALALIDRILSENRRRHIAGLPPFQGGLAGYISYDYGRRLEPHARIPDFSPVCPDLMLHHFDCVAAFDHMQERAWIISESPERADEMEELLRRRPRVAEGHVIEGWQSNFTRGDYEKAVARTVDYILAGDIFQANITQMFSAPIPQGFDPLGFYHVLRRKNPATFSAYMDYGSVQIASSSPERLLRCDGAAVEARPIKGTRRRDTDPMRDAKLIADLTSSRKDRAENVMIVDLLRNDLSRVSRPGTVKAPVLCGLETYANVHHLVSVITSEMKDGHGIGDLIGATFPGGSITGAPKIRAMEIIAEIEQAPRGVYCGAIGYIGFNGRTDLNIAIRTAQFSNGVARVQGGGGITARSEPAAEYEESITKIRRVMEAFRP